MPSDERPSATSSCYQTINPESQEIKNESPKSDKSSSVFGDANHGTVAGDTSKDANPTGEPATAGDEASTKSQEIGNNYGGLNHPLSRDSSMSVAWGSGEDSPKTKPKILEVYWEANKIRTTSSSDTISGELFLSKMVHLNYLNELTTHPTFCSDDVLYISPWIKADEKNVTDYQIKKGDNDSRDDFTKFIDGIGYIDRLRVRNLAIHIRIWELSKKTLLQNLPKFPHLDVLIFVAENLEHQATFGPINDDKEFQPLVFISTPFESVRIPVALEINERLQSKNVERKAITVEIK